MAVMSVKLYVTIMCEFACIRGRANTISGVIYLQDTQRKDYPPPQKVLQALFLAVKMETSNVDYLYGHFSSVNWYCTLSHCMSDYGCSLEVSNSCVLQKCRSCWCEVTECTISGVDMFQRPTSPHYKYSIALIAPACSLHVPTAMC